MVQWRLAYYPIFIFGTIIFLNETPSAFTLDKITDQYTVEEALRNFMVNIRPKTLTMDNVSTVGKRVTKKFSICGLSKPRKLNLCKRAMEEEDEFVNKFETHKCKRQKFEYAFHDNSKKTYNEISMYQCPDLLRRHQTTGALTEDHRRLYISRISSGIEEAMVFKQEYEGGIITAARHLLGITKNDLNTEPPPSEEIRSISRFPRTPIRSARNSPSHTTSPRIRSSPARTTPSSPAQTSSLQLSPAHPRTAGQSPSRNTLGNIFSSVFLNPIAQVPQNVNTGMNRRGTKSTTSTPMGSPLHGQSTLATLFRDAGTSTPYDSPSLSPLDPRADISSPYLSPSLSSLRTSAEYGTSPLPRRRPPPGIIMRDTATPSRRSSISSDRESTDSSSAVADSVKRGGLGSSRFASAPNIGDVIRTDRRKAVTNVSRKAGDTGTSKPGATGTSNRARDKKVAGGEPSRPTGQSKQMYRHRSFNRNTAYRSEPNSPPNESTHVFPGFHTPAPTGTALSDFIDTPPPRTIIQRTHSDEILGERRDPNIKYPMWPKSEKGSNDGSKDDSKDDSSSTIPYKKSTNNRDIKSEWMAHRVKMEALRGGKSVAEEENKAEEDISEAFASSLEKMNLISAFDKNVKRHHTNKPTVVNAPISHYSEHSLQGLFRESSEELATDLPDTSASGSSAAMKDFSVQTDLPDKSEASIQTDFPGDTDDEQESTTDTVFLAATPDQSGKVSEEGTVVPSKSSTETSDNSSSAGLTAGDDESAKVILPATKDKSVQVNQPAKKKTSVGTQVDPIKSDIITAGSSTSVGTLQPTDMVPKNTSSMLQITSDTADQVDEPEERSNIDHPPVTDLGKAADTLVRALSGQSIVEETSKNIAEKSEPSEALVIKSAYQQTSPSLPNLRSRSPSPTPPRRSLTIKEEEPERDITALPQASSGQGDTPATSTILSPPTIDIPSEYEEPVVVKPIHPQETINPGSLRRRTPSRSPSPTPTRRSTESREISLGSQERQLPIGTKDDNTSTLQKNDDQLPPKDALPKSPEPPIPPTSEPPESSQPPSGDS